MAHRVLHRGRELGERRFQRRVEEERVVAEATGAAGGGEELALDHAVHRGAGAGAAERDDAAEAGGAFGRGHPRDGGEQRAAAGVVEAFATVGA
jgi:hypothetical protein